MAARKRATRARPNADDDEARDGGDDAQAPPESVTEAALADAAERVNEREPEARISYVDDAGKDQYLDTVALSLVSEEWIAETYGGGKFKALKRGKTEGGKWGYIGHDTYDIDPSLPFKGSMRKQREDRARRESYELDMAGASIHNADGSRVGGSRMDSIIESGVLSLMKRSEESSTQSMQMFMNMMAESRQSAQAQMTMVMKMMETMGANSRPATSPLVEILAAAAAPAIPEIIKSLMGRKDNQLKEVMEMMERLKPKDEGTKLSDTLEMMAKLKEIAQDVAGDSEPVSPWLKVMERIGDVLPAILARVPQPAAAPVAAPGVTMVHSPASPGVPGATPMPPDGGGVPMINGPDDVWNIIGENLTLMRGAAAIGRDPRRVAAMAIELASPAQRGLMGEVLATEDFTKMFFEKFPQMESYRNWTTSFIEELKAELFGGEYDDDLDGDDGDTPAGEPSTDKS